MLTDIADMKHVGTEMRIQLEVGLEWKIDENNFPL